MGIGLGLGLSLTRSKGGGGLSGDFVVRFGTMANGAPTFTTTGQPVVRETGSVDPTASIPVIVNGRLTAPVSSAGTSTGAYAGVRLAEEMKNFYAIGSFSDQYDAAPLLSAADVSLPAILASSVHIVFAAGSWQIEYFTQNTRVPVFNGSFTPVPFGVDCRFGWRFSGNDIYLLLPNGQEIGPYNSPEVVSRANHCAIFELYRSVSGAPGLSYREAAFSLFADPAAAGRTNLLVAANDLSNAAWLRNRFDVPTLGLPDRKGGLTANQALETALSGSHNIRQTVAKASSAKRYTWRYDFKPIGAGRDWVQMWLTDDVFSDQAQRFLQASTGLFGVESGSFTDKTWMVYPYADGWCQMRLDCKSDAGPAVNAWIALAEADNDASYLGEVTKGFQVADLYLIERPL